MTGPGKIIALLVAAGSGTRAGGGLPKQYVQVGGKALLIHALDHLRHPLISQVRVVIGEGQEEHYQRLVGDRAGRPIIGGSTRQQSVRNGIEAIAAEGGCDTVLIHDAARPFLPASVIERLIEALGSAQAAVPVLPVVDSLAVVGDELGEPVSRDHLVRVQTPQAFSFADILDAHRSWSGSADATDDAQVARSAGISVVTIAGSPSLEKLTYSEDLDAADKRIAPVLTSRTGLGFDVHAFAEGEDLWLGGIRIEHHRGLSGHSDADVALHALTDALLGAVGEGDIGDHFPPSDPQWRGAASGRFVEHARDIIERRGGRIDHVDLTIICEAPKIGPHRMAMRESIAHLLRLPLSRISVKATTTERLGFAGRGEGIAAQAVATIRMPEE